MGMDGEEGNNTAVGSNPEQFIELEGSSEPERPVLHARRLALENARFLVYMDELRGQGHLLVRDYLVVIPKTVNPGMITGVAVLPICEEKFGLLQVYRHPLEADSWEVPRGFVDEGESDVVSALRELEEETGLSCDPAKAFSLGVIAPDAGVLASRLHLFVATECVQTRPYGPTEMGHKEFRLFNANEIEKMIRHSVIQDPSTLAAYFKYAHRMF